MLEFPHVAAAMVSGHGLGHCHSLSRGVKSWVGRRQVLAMAWLAMPFIGQAQPISRSIGFLSPYSRTQSASFKDVFLQALRLIGHVEGKDFRLVEAYADNSGDRLLELARHLVAAKVDVIFVSTTNVAVAAQQATDRIPIVFYSVSDPVRAGLADSMAKPGRNLTGLTNVSGDLNGKRLQLLRQLVPTLEHVSVLANASNPYISTTLERLRPAAESLSLSTSLARVRNREDLAPAFVEMSSRAASAVLVTADVEFYLWIDEIARLGLKSRMPTMFPFASAVAAGGLMSYGVDEHDAARHVAIYIDKIFRGAKPADLPIEQPTKLELLVNRRTTSLLGLTIPASILMQAQVIG